MAVISFISQAGGVGKTSLTFHTAGTMAALLDRSILLIDGDPQTNLTQGLWGAIRTDELDPARTVVSILRGESPDPNMVIHPTGLPNIDIIPGSSRSELLNMTNPWSLEREVQSRYREFLDGVAEKYDHVFIDCQRGTQFCSWAALAASDFVVIPVQPEDFGVLGIKPTIEFMAGVQSRGFPVQLLGMVISRTSTRGKIHQAYEQVLREGYGDMMFRSRVKYLADFADAVTLSQPICYFKPQSQASMDIYGVAKELEDRIDALLQKGSEKAA